MQGDKLATRAGCSRGRADVAGAAREAGNPRPCGRCEGEGSITIGAPHDRQNPASGRARSPSPPAACARKPARRNRGHLLPGARPAATARPMAGRDQGPLARRPCSARGEAARGFARRAPARTERPLDVRPRAPSPAARGLSCGARPAGLRTRRSGRVKRPSRAVIGKEDASYFSRRVPRPIFLARSERACA